MSGRSSIHHYNTWNINIQGGAIIDFDKNQLLKDVECIYPRSAWIKSQSLFIPEPILYGDIYLIDIKSNQGDSIQYYSSKRRGEQFFSYQVDDTGVKILTDNSFSVAWILLGNPDRSGDWVGLSERCSALIRDDELLGFAVNLADAPLRIFKNRLDKQLKQFIQEMIKSDCT